MEYSEYNSYQYKKPVMRRGKAKDNRACDNCRRRKIRCYAKELGTGCQFCTRMHFACTYNDPVLKRGPKSSLVSRFGHYNTNINSNVNNFNNSVQYLNGNNNINSHTYHTSPTELYQDSLRNDVIGQVCGSKDSSIYSNTAFVKQYHTNSPEFLNKLSSVNVYLRLRARELQLQPEMIPSIIGFFMSFGPNHSMISLDMFLKLIHMPVVPSTLPLLIHSMACNYISHHPDTSPAQLELCYQTATSLLPRPTDLSQKLLYASMNLLDRSQVYPPQPSPHHHRVHTNRNIPANIQLPSIFIPDYTTDSIVTPQSLSFSKNSSSPTTPTTGIRLPSIHSLLSPSTTNDEQPSVFSS